MKTPPQFNIGWEVEAVRKAQYYNPDLILGYDTSVAGEQAEYRLNASVIGDNRNVMNLLRELMATPRLKLDNSCGYHVHLSPVKDNRKASQWAGWMMTLGQCIEKVMFKALPRSRSSNRYCWLLSDSAPKSFHPTKVRYPSGKYHNDYRHAWIHPTEIYRPGGIGTVEIRNMGESQDYMYLHAWTLICLLMAQKAWALIDDPSELHSRVKEMESALSSLIAYQATHRRVNLTNCVRNVGYETGYYDKTPILGLVGLGRDEATYIDQRHWRNKNTVDTYIRSIVHGDRLHVQTVEHNHSFTESSHSIGGGAAISLPTPYMTKSCSGCHEFSRYIEALETQLSSQQFAMAYGTDDGERVTRNDPDDQY